MGITVISLPTELMWALHTLLFGVNVSSWICVKQDAVICSKSSTSVSGNIVITRACLPGFCVGGYGTSLTHADKRKVGRSVNYVWDAVERERRFLKRSVACQSAESDGGSVKNGLTYTTVIHCVGWPKHDAWYSVFLYSVAEWKW